MCAGGESRCETAEENCSGKRWRAHDSVSISLVLLVLVIDPAIPTVLVLVFALVFPFYKPFPALAPAGAAALPSALALLPAD